MNHIDIRLAEITDKLDGLIGFMNGYFGKLQSRYRASRQNTKCAGPRRTVDLKIAAVESEYGMNALALGQMNQRRVGQLRLEAPVTFQDHRDRGCVLFGQ